MLRENAKHSCFHLGSILVPSLFLLGIVSTLVPSWLGLGSILVPSWFHLGSILVPSRFVLGSILVPNICKRLEPRWPLLVIKFQHISLKNKLVGWSVGECVCESSQQSRPCYCVERKRLQRRDWGQGSASQ